MSHVVMSEFERQVLSDLSELKAQMHWLMGNGKPGRIQMLEDRLTRHEAYVQRAAGVGSTLMGLLTLLQVGLAWMRLRLW